MLHVFIRQVSLTLKKEPAFFIPGNYPVEASFCHPALKRGIFAAHAGKIKLFVERNIVGFTVCETGGKTE